MLTHRVDAVQEQQGGGGGRTHRVDAVQEQQGGGGGRTHRVDAVHEQQGGGGGRTHRVDAVQEQQGGGSGGNAAHKAVRGGRNVGQESMHATSSTLHKMWVPGSGGGHTSPRCVPQHIVTCTHTVPVYTTIIVFISTTARRQYLSLGPMLPSQIMFTMYNVQQKQVESIIFPSQLSECTKYNYTTLHLT